MLRHASVLLVWVFLVGFSFADDDFRPIFPSEYTQTWKPSGNSRSFKLDQNEHVVKEYVTSFIPSPRSSTYIQTIDEDLKKPSDLNDTKRHTAIPSNNRRSLNHIDVKDEKPSSRSITSEVTDAVSLLEEALEIQKDLDDFEARGRLGKKYRRYLLPLLLAYKLKFFALIPLMMGGLVLLASSTGFAGFFFALFAATMGLKVGH